MNRVAGESARERAALFRAAAARRQTTPAVVEKDFWLCWTLGRLFADTAAEPSFLFKGGTSLSKAYDAISRFSEDVDLSIAPAVIGERLEDAYPLSNTQRRRLFERMVAAGRAYLRETMVPRLCDDFAGVLGGHEWRVEVDAENPDAILFAYPAATDPGGYVAPRLLLEFGVRSELDPWEPRRLRPYAADALPEAFGGASVVVPTLVAERTFWEKATLLHATYHQPETRSVRRMSRHYADLAALLRHPAGEAAIADLALLERVVRHKSVFYAAASARYELAVPGTLRLAPHPALRQRLEADYREMREMFFGDAPVRPFAGVVEDLKALEERLNAG